MLFTVFICYLFIVSSIRRVSTSELLFFKRRLAKIIIILLSYRNEKQYITLPKNIQDAKNLGTVLQKYNKNHFYSVLIAFFSAYVL